MGLLQMIWSGIVSLAALFMWPVAKVRSSQGIRQALRWGLHFVFVGATVALLWYLNYACELDKALKVPVATLRHAWLPLLFLLTYCTAWCTWWLWRLLMSEDRPSEFPDIDAAWNEATNGLEKSGVDLTKAPIFLVVGRPIDTEAAFFSATQLPFTHPQIPRDPNAPLHVHVADEGIFITCPGASLLGAQTAMLAADRVWKREEPLVSKGRSIAHSPKETDNTANLPPIHIEDEDTALTASISPRALPKEPIGNGSEVSRGSSATSTATATKKPSGAAAQLSQGLSLVEESIALLTEEDQAVPDFALDLLYNEEPQSDAAAVPVDIPLVKDLGEIQAIQARLEHLCRLIATAREPYCPLNGVAVLIPYAAASSDRIANQVAALAQRDLETIQHTLNVRCPLVAIVCDLQEAPGCREMIQLFPEEQRNRRLGVRFPLICNDPAASVVQMIDNGVRWICRDLLPPLVYRLMRGTESIGQAARTTSPTNARLYRFLDDLRQREQRLCRMMRQVFTAGNERDWLPAGCYLVANGSDLAREQGFAAGVLPQLYQMQNLLAWSHSAIESDQKKRRLVVLGYCGLALVAGLIGLAFLRLL